MQGSDHRAASGPVRFNPLRQEFLAICIERVEWFIQQPELAIVERQTRQSGAALLPRGQHSARHIGRARQTNPFQDCTDIALAAPNFRPMA